MPYSRSIALRGWLHARRRTLDALAEIDIAGSLIGDAYVVRVVAEFQGFVRELHDLAAYAAVGLAGARSTYASLLVEAMTGGRAVDRGNADVRSIARDFGRLGVRELGGRMGTRADRASYARLIALRNALAHGNERQVDLLRAEGTRDGVSWTRRRIPALNRIARALDRAVWDHLVTEFGGEPGEW